MLIQEKMKNTSKKITVILKLGFLVSNILMLLALAAIGILQFSGKELKASFLAAFDVTANNGTVISISPQALVTMFAFMLIDTILIAAMIFIIHSIFNDINKEGTPFLHRNATRMKYISIIAIILSIVGGYSDALVDYYTIGQLTWRVDIIGLIIGVIIYCISLIFSYGCDLQQESDETL